MPPRRGAGVSPPLPPQPPAFPALTLQVFIMLPAALLLCVSSSWRVAVVYDPRYAMNETIL